jgi:2-dehydro-3-deoxyphosphooctonate aldolase (KDO 8-P synthase)
LQNRLVAVAAQSVCSDLLLDQLVLSSSVSLVLFQPAQLLLIAGPCSLENERVCRTVAESLVAIRRSRPELNLVFKGSFDKANRTSLAGARGTGIDAGLALLDLVRKEYQLPVLTDIHETAQVGTVAAVCDVLQIPAFLCRQTDLLLAAAATGRVVNVKKGQFLSPQEMQFVTGKLREGKAREVWQTERGTTFGYQNLVVDMRSFSVMKQYGFPTVFDATHSVQLPGAGGGKSSGQREFVAPLSRAALAAGADGLFIETHPDPANAISDGPNMVPLAEMAALIDSCLAVWSAVRSKS